MSEKKEIWVHLQEGKSQWYLLDWKSILNVLTFMFSLFHSDQRLPSQLSSATRLRQGLQSPVWLFLCSSARVSLLLLVVFKIPYSRWQHRALLALSVSLGNLAKPSCSVSSRRISEVCSLARSSIPFSPPVWWSFTPTWAKLPNHSNNPSESMSPLITHISPI